MKKQTKIDYKKMTPERKNEIWAMLPEDVKAAIKDLWECNFTMPYGFDIISVIEGAIYVLDEIFGRDNLIAPIEGIKPFATKDSE